MPATATLTAVSGTAPAVDQGQRDGAAVSKIVLAPAAPGVPAPAPAGGRPVAPPASAAPHLPFDRREFDALIAEHRSGLFNRAMQLCRNHIDADDLLQETLVRAWRASGSLRERARPRAWLLTILSNTFVDRLRKQRSSPQTVPLDQKTDVVVDGDAVEPLPWDHITTEQLHAAIDQLPADLRDTYRLNALEGKDYAEISAILGIPKSTVGTRLNRARKRLRALLAPGVEGTP